jgi:hypothetical protein
MNDEKNSHKGTKTQKQIFLKKKLRAFVFSWLKFNKEGIK